MILTPIPSLAQDKAAPKTALEVKAAGPRTFYADSRVGNNQVTILSESTLEDFTGVCNQVGGECRFDPHELESFRGRFSLHVADIKTGIDLRDEHMRGPDWLDAAGNPNVAVEITGVESAKKTASDTATLTLLAKCTLRGKTNELKIPATLRYMEETPETMRRVKGDLIRIRAEFTVKLSEYGVTGPEGSGTVGLKVSDEIQIKVTVFGSTERPPESLKPDQPQHAADVQRAPPKRPDKP